MREIALDTETTGISLRDGHRIIEIGALELMHHLPTGRKLHLYINPERDIDDGAVAVHGITSDFLADKPVFANIVDEFLAFVGDDPMVIHNASFDMGFINAELKRLDRPALLMAQSIDTLMMARKKFPGAQANLDALCRRFEIDNAHRDLHGALVDADLLAAVYIELLGGRQPVLSLELHSQTQHADEGAENGLDLDPSFHFDARSVRPIRAHEPTAEELRAHAKFLEELKNPIWQNDA
ncbi:DNA polymerase III subunit epsilon [Candidatus Puniceispirillum sp.]|nr:DNA polymerase III subunit epsilon [Alphaproteobacteria bacterium]MDC1293710.1 DNA polymerase III subunit epsilon [Candidatus Puniceispirillum sp.]